MNKSSLSGHFSQNQENIEDFGFLPLPCLPDSVKNLHLIKTNFYYTIWIAWNLDNTTFGFPRSSAMKGISILWIFNRYNQKWLYKRSLRNMVRQLKWEIATLINICEKKFFGINIYPCRYRLKFEIQRHRRFQHLAKPIDSRKFEVGQKRYGYAQLMRYALPK